MSWLLAWIRRILGVEERLFELECALVRLDNERKGLIDTLANAVELNKQLSEDSQINNKAISLLRGLTMEIEPVLKRNKTIKDEMRRRCVALEGRIDALEVK